MPRKILTAAACALTLGLAGCESFDPLDKLQDWDIMGANKKPLPGERRAVFPEGVPGVPQGVPRELVKGYQVPEEPAPAPPPVVEKQKPKKTAARPKPKRAPEAAQPQPAQTRTTTTTQPAPQQQGWPAPPPQQAWPAPPPPPQPAQWPDPPGAQKR